MAKSERNRILKLASRGELPNRIDDSTDLDLEVIAQLCRDGLLQGIDVSTLAGKAFLNLSITQAGIDIIAKSKSKVTYTLTHFALPVLAAIVAGLVLNWLLSKENNRVVSCSYVSIKALGWNSGHKTNFCIANGYPQGNFNWGNYKNGGICMAGDAEICKASVKGMLPNTHYCEPEGNRTICYEK